MPVACSKGRGLEAGKKKKEILIMKINNIYNKIKIRFGRTWRSLSYVTGNTSCLLRHTSYVIFCLLALTACIDDKLDVNCSDDSSSSDNAKGQLSFTMHIDGSFSTRADGDASNIVEGYENYVDKDNLHILFLDEDGYFLFEATNPSFSEIDNKGDYTVGINLNAIKGFTTGVIKNYLTQKPYHIAILANWPSGVPLWGWEDSQLNSEVTKPKTIHNLHHIFADNTYANKSEGKYNFLLEGGNIGLNYNWVKNRGEINGESADTWIRENWDPEDEKSTDPNYQKYTKLWQLWNLGGSYDVNALPYSEFFTQNMTENMAEKVADKWNKANGNEFKKWLGTENKNLTEEKTIGDFYFNPGDETENGSDENKQKGGISSSYHSGGYHGIKLARTNYIEKKNGKDYINFTDNKTKGYIRIPIYSSGYLTIKGFAPEGDASIMIQRGTTPVTSLTISQSSEISNFKNDGKEIDNYQIKVTDDPEDIYIFTNSDKPVVICAIEFICSTYLSETDRIGVAPTQSQPIPMYGIQEFAPIDASDWLMYNENDPYDITAENGNKKIALIRSVAKVELYFTEKPKHVYMRCMNRKARCETMDVLSPTDESFGKDHEDGKCEWFNIQRYGSGYNSSVGYQTWLSWFYGTWENWKSSITPPENNLIPYPQIFNPDIERSDFCEFLYVDYQNVAAKGKTYHKYVLYVPDKNIMDSGSVGSLSGNAKVIHVEYRYDNNSDNLDDNGCHRLYFTDYTTNGTIKTVKANEYESKIEGKAEELNKLWPIMRNHVYRFYVTSSSQDTQDVEVFVGTPKWQYEQSHDEW